MSAAGRSLFFGVVATAIIALSTADATACVLAKGWVAPTVEQLIEQSDRAFIGTVLALRGDDGVPVADHPGDGKSELSAIFRVDVAIRGVTPGQLIEVPQGTDSCSPIFRTNERWMFPGSFGPDWVRELPSAEKINAWRRLPRKPSPAPSTIHVECPNFSTFEQLANSIKRRHLSFVGTITGLRRDDTVLLTEAPSCPAGGGPDASPDCQQFWSHILSVQFEVKTAFRGTYSGASYETPAWPPAVCVPYVPGDYYLFTDSEFRPMQEARSPEVLTTLLKAAQPAH